jgi:protocatechuate 4,5-dioxygenase, alpha chain
MTAESETRRPIALPPRIMVYDGRKAVEGYRLNRLAISIRDADNRARFKADEEGYMRTLGLDEAERALVRARDWLGMVAHGGNMYALIKIARALGIHQSRVGVQMRGETVEEFMRTRPVAATGIASRDDLDEWRV